MASKQTYLWVAALGMAAASGAAWWLQRAPSAADAPQTAAAAPKGAAAARVPAVEVAQVAQSKWVDEVQAVGSLRSRQGVMLRPEVAGRVKQLAFAEGQRVQKGQLLVQLDDALPQAQMGQARAEVDIAQANHKRNQDLVGQGFVSKRAADESEAALAVARAKLDLAQATLQRLRVVAPFDGVMGLKQISVGDYLKDGADMVNIEDMDAVLVDFRLPERFQSRIRAGQKAQLSADAAPGQSFAALVQAVDPLIDANARSVGVRGCVDNRQRLLRPGMFVRVNAVFGVRDKAMSVPEEAIVPQGGRSFVIKLVAGEQPGAWVSQRVAVQTGLRQPGKVEIVEGLAVGDTVVTAGQQRLQKDGTAVRVLDAAAPAKPGAAPAASAASAAGQPEGGKPASAPGGSGAAGGAGSAAPRAAAPAGPSPCLKG